MANELATTNKPNKPITIRQYIVAPEVQKRIKEMLDERASEFTTSVISIAGNDAKLAKCEPRSLFNACLTAASMRLPISKELAMAHIIPYENKKQGVIEAQIQLGWRAYVQLAQRSGEYKTIAAAAIYNGQLVSSDPLRGNVYDFSEAAKKSDDIVGYAALFVLRNGFEKDLFMSMDELEAHALRYSKAYQWDKNPKNQYGESSPWSTNFDAMSKKTVIKLLIKNFGPMSIDMQKAVQADQAIVKDDDNFEYVDGELASVGASEDKKAAIIAANQEEDTAESDNAPVTDEDLDNLETSGGQATLINDPKAASYGDNPNKRPARK
ncbi:MAG: recombinase RecT [Ktedonobacteraceae bacterium]